MSKPFFFIVILLFVRLGLAQNNIYKFNHITDANGLSQNSIIAMHQDKLGQMWIGTRDGLNKYDGEEFTTYKHQKNKSNSISSNSILSIEDDSKGNIWVGTSFGLNKYNPKKNSFKTYFVKKENTFIGSNMISAIKKMSNNEIWIGSASGLSVYNEKTDTFNSILNKNHVTSILETKTGAIFIGTTKGVFQLVDKKRFSFRLISGTKNRFIQDIIEGNEAENILIATQKVGVLEFNIPENFLTPYFKDSLLKGKSKNIRKLLIDDKGVLWMGSYNGLQISNHKDHLIALFSDDNDDMSINDNFIKTLYKDTTGEVWVGTYYGGLNICSNFNKNFINITQKKSKAGLSFKAVSSIASYKDYLLFGTAGGGISVLNPKTNTIKYITTKNSLNLKSDNIKSLCVTSTEKLWIGTFTSGVAIYNLKTEKFEDLPFPETLKNLLQKIGVLSIVEYDNDFMLLGTNSKGLIKYNIKTNTYKLFNRYANTSFKTSNYIKTISTDKDGNIWVGTLRGLNCITRDEVVSNYIYTKDLKIKFQINAINEDKNGVIFLGTAEDGLFKFENKEFKPVDLKVDNTQIDAIGSIVKTEDDKFWISTHTQGVLKYDPSSNKIEVHYTKKDGLKSNQFNRNASLRLNKSQYYFGGPVGVTYFDESKLTKNTYSPQVIITDFKTQNTSVAIDGNQKILNKTITYTKELELDYNQGNFSLSFAIPNFINSDSNSYLYRLKGLETDWVKTSNNTASFTIQKPGNYTFEVKGINSDGVVNQNPTTLQILVNPAPWPTWWAYSLYILFASTAIFYLFSILKSKTKLKYQLALERVKVEQTEKINKSKLEFFTNLSHEFRTPLTLISGPLQQILENYNGSSKMFKRLKVIESSANHLLKLINRLMDFRKYENKLMKLEAAEGNIVKFIKEIYLSFSEYAKVANYQYNLEVSNEVIKVFYDREKLERVFFNLISNAFKYTPRHGEITIEIEEQQEHVLIYVKDTGNGISENYREMIFERFFEIPNKKQKNNVNKGTGIGLFVVKNIIDLHKGTIKVTNNSNNIGTVFTIKLLKGKNHLSTSEILENFKFSEDITTYKNQLKEEVLLIEDKHLKNIPQANKASILIVEDNKELRTFIYKLLSKDYNIFEAENGEEGYKTAIREQIDIIVSDVVMPITTGTELCALIKSDVRTSHIPVILLTTRTALVYKLEGLSHEADDYISKPFNIIEFKLRISNILKLTSRLKQKISSNEMLPTEDMLLSSLDEKLYKKALQIIEKNISNALFDIPYFCEELGVSKSVLFVKVKAWTDFTPKQFIQHIRLKYAARFLEQGKMSIGQISTKVGFKNQKHFSKTFKSKYGKTPKEYSQSFQEE